MDRSSNIEMFWLEYLSMLPEEDRGNAPAYLIDDFADMPEAATKVGKLVRDGIKTTSSSLLWGLEQLGIPLPKAGDVSVIVDGNGEPLCIIEMVNVEIRPFNTVDEQFAYDYGKASAHLPTGSATIGIFTRAGAVRSALSPVKPCQLSFNVFACCIRNQVTVISKSLC